MREPNVALPSIVKRLRYDSLRLDFRGAALDPKVITNLSAVGVSTDGALWTVSDEGRTIERSRPRGDGFVFNAQFDLNSVFEGIPGRKKQAEADLESLDIAGGRLWVCGSHCRVRRQHDKIGSDSLDPRFRDRPSRHLLGRARVTKAGLVDGQCLPFEDEGSLRDYLGENEYLAPFLNLPSKENGLDIEGLSVVGSKVFLGLRGPLVDSIAIVVQLRIPASWSCADMTEPRLHFVDLEGLAVRDLTRWEDQLLILAGPVSSARGPFKLFAWTPRNTPRIQKPDKVHTWPEGWGQPEGICRLDRNGTSGLIILRHDRYGSRQRRRLSSRLARPAGIQAMIRIGGVLRT